MSSLSRAVVFAVPSLLPHPNADRLELVEFEGRPAIVQKGLHKVGDLCVFVPEDMVASDEPEFDFLGDKKRIQAKRLRGVFSMGLILKARAGWVEGQDVTEELRLTKYEPPPPKIPGFNLGKAPSRQAPNGAVGYTDIESLRKYKDVLTIGEEVVATTKVHGSNSRFLYEDGSLHIGSHHRWLDPSTENVWTRVAKKYELDGRLALLPNKIIFGEVFGSVQKGFNYGVPQGDVEFRAFDIWDCDTRRYLDYNDFLAVCSELKLPVVPEIYRGPWLGFEEMKGYAEGQETSFDGATHVREGFVVRPIHERWDHKVGRIILKLHGEGFLLTK